MQGLNHSPGCLPCVSNPNFSSNPKGRETSLYLCADLEINPTHFVLRPCLTTGNITPFQSEKHPGLLTPLIIIFLQYILCLSTEKEAFSFPSFKLQEKKRSLLFCPENTEPQFEPALTSLCCTKEKNNLVCPEAPPGPGRDGRKSQGRSKIPGKDENPREG